MKLLTHNMLTSKSMKKVVTGYPLHIQARDVKVMEVEFKQDFVARIIPKVDWECLCRAAEELGHLDDLPTTVPDNYESNVEFLKKAHHVLLEVSQQQFCPSGKIFHGPILGGSHQRRSHLSRV